MADVNPAEISAILRQQLAGSNTEAELQEMLDAQMEAIANPPVVGKLPSNW